MDLTQENKIALERLRNDKAMALIKPIQQILLRYYPKNTKLVINKDYWKFEYEEDIDHNL